MAHQVSMNLTEGNPIMCFRATAVSSGGWWGGKGPTDFSLPLLLIQISLLYAATRLSHFLLRPLCLPSVVSQVIAGIIVGPSCLSRPHGPLSRMFPHRSYVHLNSITLLSFILYIFVVAVKTDLSFPRKSRRKALAISEASSLPPLLLSSLLSRSLSPSLPLSPSQLFLFRNNFPIRWATSSNIVLFCLLSDLNLLASKLGRIAMTASLLSDLQGIVLKAVLSSLFHAAGHVSVELTLLSLLSLAVLVLFILFVARPTVIWMVRRTPDGMPMNEGYLLAVVVTAMFCSLVGEIIGQHIATGAMILGLLLPGGPPLGTTLAERLERLMEGVFVPVYVAVVGLNADVWSVGDARVAWFTVMMIAVSAAAKIAAVVGTGVYFGMAVRDAAAVGLMLNFRGIMELYTFRTWQETKLADIQTYTIHVLAVILIGSLTSPILKLTYNPAKHFINPHKRRSVDQTIPSQELRVLACAHDEHNATPLLSLLETSLPNPVCVYLLHLTPLVGQINSVLAPYKPKKHSSAVRSQRHTVTDHIVNAFRSLEYANIDSLSVQPFVAVSPFATMHTDICQLAFDSKCALILLPFHRYSNAESGVPCTNPSVRAVNMSVLHYAPCSVAIFLDYGISGGPRLHRSIAVYFLGGPDDREALAYASRLAANDRIGLTVIRPVLPQSLRQGNKEEAIDEDAVRAFKAMNAGNKRVDYREEEVKDGTEMIEVVRATSRDYSLVIVGRREGERSRLTEGLEMWSEYPELGVVGDLMASEDLGEKVATLVVQQMPTRDIGGGGGETGDAV